MEIEKIRDASYGFAKRQKEMKTIEDELYKRRNRGIIEKVKDRRADIRGGLPLKETGDFTDEEFYGFRWVPEKYKEIPHNDLKIEMGGHTRNLGYLWTRKGRMTRGESEIWEITR